LDANVTPDVVPDYQNKTADIDFSVTEKGGSQIELQGGYGGGAFIGTLGLSFNNFSIRNIFNKEAYTPLPTGDGQTLSLRLQTSRTFSTYSFSFTEPWLGGKKPQSLSFSVYSSNQFQIDPETFNVDRDRSLGIVGASVGLGKRLKWPDDFFQLSQSIAFQSFNLKNYNFRVGDAVLNNGNLKNLSYSATLARNSAGPSLIFPTYGSEFSIGVKATLPYSLITGNNFEQPQGLTAQQQNDFLADKFEWLEYYKFTAKGKWYTSFTDKLVLMTNAEFGYLGFYNKEIGLTPFERYFVGGDGIAVFQLDGREVVGLRGYENSVLSANTFNPFDVRRSAGVGVRIFMPAFGLLGIDFAHGFDPIPGQTIKSGWQTHFIIGRQF